MTKAHPHRQINVHLDTVDDADVIERIEAQPSMVGYIRELVRRDIHGERLDYVALKTSELQSENAKLREQMERLVTLLRNDCDIDASWDGLRRFWSIELTEDGCLMRDRACKAEAENARLRAARDTWAENDAKLRELVRVMAYCNQFRRDCDGCSMNGAAGIITERAGCDELLACLRELGIGVSADA